MYLYIGVILSSEMNEKINDKIIVMQYKRLQNEFT